MRVWLTKLLAKTEMKPDISGRMFKALLLGAVIAAGSLFGATPDNRPSILYCLADDWSWPHAGVYGDRVIQTPTFDRVARSGMLFNYCFSAAPSCSSSRAAMLTGQYSHRLEEGSCLWGFLPHKFPVYPDLLEKTGYVVGSTRKGWGPGDFKAGGYDRNPAGLTFASFDEFFKTVPEGKPFCFWFGSHDPHRPYVKDSGVTNGLKTDHVVIPAFWPDNETSRRDVLDYYWAVQRYDREVGEILDMLKKAGRLTNTIVVMSGDNGWPFPRCKANLYDGGTRQPLAVMWPEKVKAGQVCDDFINLMDLAPTFLEAAGLKPLPEMTGQSFFGLLTGEEKCGSRNVVYVERERHANARPENVGYPMRAVRTRDFLYIRNLRPDRWPAGNPRKDIKRTFADCDDGPTKEYIVEHRDDPDVKFYFELCFAKRPAEELYDLKSDPRQTNNIIALPQYADAHKKLRAQLDQWMLQTADPRATNDDDHWDTYPYFGAGNQANAKKKN